MSSSRLLRGEVAFHRQIAPLAHFVLAICRNHAATNINAEWPSGNAPTTRVRRRISRMIRPNGLLVRICRSDCAGRQSRSASRAPSLRLAPRPWSLSLVMTSRILSGAETCRAARPRCTSSKGLTAPSSYTRLELGLPLPASGCFRGRGAKTACAVTAVPKSAPTTAARRHRGRR
jgi:hypothetical protein